MTGKGVLHETATPTSTGYTACGARVHVCSSLFFTDTFILFPKRGLVNLDERNFTN